MPCFVAPDTPISARYEPVDGSESMVFFLFPSLNLFESNYQYLNQSDWLRDTLETLQLKSLTHNDVPPQQQRTFSFMTSHAQHAIQIVLIWHHSDMLSLCSSRFNWLEKSCTIETAICTSPHNTQLITMLWTQR